MNNFWKKLNKPIFVLAPMADVTDIAFRTVITKYGKPDVTWTEFVSADGLMRAPEEGKQKLMKDLLYTEAERPIVAQLFSSNPEYMEGAAKLVEELGFDGIDINMGCPDKSIEKQGCGSAMIKNPENAKEIIRAAKKGAPSIPVSVKTRLGYNEDQLEEWLPELLKEEPAVVTLHARTRKEMSKVPARWERVKRAVEIRDELGSETLIIGNGDVISLKDAEEKVKETGCDGVMIGRGIFGNPWRFNKEVDREDISIEERLKVMLEHTELFEKNLSHKSFAVMKKHYKAYIDGFPGAKELRIKLMETQSFDEVREVVEEFIKTLK
jgi:nifR3 family TIM-barrel protein